MGCLVNLFKCLLAMFIILIMLIVGVKLIFDPYSPDEQPKPRTDVTYPADDGEYKTTPSQTEFNYDVPVQSGPDHEYIMENTFQKSGVVMELTPQLEHGLVYVIKVFKSQLGEDFYPTITSAHDSFHIHDKWSKHRYGKAVDIRMNDLPLDERRRVVRILKQTLPKEYKVIWESQYTPNEHLHFQSKH